MMSEQFFDLSLTPADEEEQQTQQASSRVHPINTQISESETRKSPSFPVFRKHIVSIRRSLKKIPLFFPSKEANITIFHQLRDEVKDVEN